MRAAIITHNNPDFTAEEYLEKWWSLPETNYVNGQLEKGKEGTVHIQAYVQIKRGQRLSWWKKRDSKAHFEFVRLDNGASTYCLKEESRLEGPWEFGKRPIQRNKQTDW